MAVPSLIHCVFSLLKQHEMDHFSIFFLSGCDVLGVVDDLGIDFESISKMFSLNLQCYSHNIKAILAVTQWKSGITLVSTLSTSKCKSERGGKCMKSL